MGHGQKNANRAAAIAKNSERYRKLKAAVESLDKEQKGQRRALEMEVERRRRHELAFLERVELLERPLWQKARDGIAALYRRAFPVNETGFEIVEDEATDIPAEDLEAAAETAPAKTQAEEPEPAIEIVPPPEQIEAVKKEAAELLEPPPDE